MKSALFAVQSLDDVSETLNWWKSWQEWKLTWTPNYSYSVSRFHFIAIRSISVLVHAHSILVSRRLFSVVFLCGIKSITQQVLIASDAQHLTLYPCSCKYRIYKWKHSKYVSLISHLHTLAVSINFCSFPSLRLCDFLEILPNPKVVSCQHALFYIPLFLFSSTEIFRFSLVGMCMCICQHFVSRHTA